VSVTFTIFWATRLIMIGQEITQIFFMDGVCEGIRYLKADNKRMGKPVFVDLNVTIIRFRFNQNGWAIRGKISGIICTCG
jgi:hypothetical protein